MKPRTLRADLRLEIRRAEIGNVVRELEHVEDVEAVHALSLELLAKRNASELAEPDEDDDDEGATP